MPKNSSQITCPNCGEHIDVNEIVYHQLDNELKKKYQTQFAKEQQKLEAEKVRITQQQDEYTDKLASEVKQQLKTEKGKLEKLLKKQLSDEQGEQLAALQAELNEKSAQVKNLNQAKAEVERLKREKLELKDSIELELQEKLNKQLTKEKLKIQQLADSKAQFSITEKETVINQLKEQLQIAQQKVEQGSTQLQGEVQELAIENWLVEKFPLDNIEEIKKGQKGGDCLQTVNTRLRQNCGIIYYESKRTKAFQPNWIEKFKADIQDKNANIGVLVTEAMPSDMNRLGLRDGIWICSFDEFKGLSSVLRESIIQISNAIISQENKGDKMGMLYDFLSSNEFRLQIEAIVEGFTQMKSDLDSEKRAMQSIWKKREKQIDKVLLNTNHMYGSIKGIAGNAIQSVALLELDSEDFTDKN